METNPNDTHDTYRVCEVDKKENILLVHDTTNSLNKARLIKKFLLQTPNDLSGTVVILNPLDKIIN